MTDRIFCCYCGRLIKHPLIRTTEHLVPVSAGGNETRYNKRSCCSDCNYWRGSKSFDYWLSEINNLLNEHRVRPPYSRYDLNILIENIRYVQHYVTTAGNKLLK